MKKHFLILIASFGVLLNSCRKEQPELPGAVNPCQNARYVTADFLMEERSTPLNVDVLFTNTDTIFKNKNVRFTALEDDADYTWYIGSEVIKERSFGRFFSDQLAGLDIPITLVVRKDPNKLCIPDDNGYDSLTKILHVSNVHLNYFGTGANGDTIHIDLGALSGTFRVKSDHLSDSFDVKISFYEIPTGFFCNIENYDGEGSNCLFQSRPKHLNYRSIRDFNGTAFTQCNAMQGLIEHKLNGTTTMNLSFRYNSGLVDRTFRNYIGRKLN